MNPEKTNALPPRLRTPEARHAFARDLLGWFDAAARDLPWRRTRDPYAVAVSEFMLQQTQVATAAGYYRRWMRRFPTWASVARAAEAEVLRLWQGLGYYSRARNLRRAAAEVVARHGGVLPADAGAIRALPGVGPYTAAAVAAFAFDLPEPVLDANVVRVLARLADFREPVDAAVTRRALEGAARALLPADGPGRFSAALMELGALVCRAGVPRCDICPVRQHCAAVEPGALPVKRPRPTVVEEVEACLFARRNGRVLLELETGRRWRGLWRLPRREEGLPAGELLGEFRYTVTRHRVTLRVYRAGPGVDARSGDGVARRWFALPVRVAMPSPHRRAIETLAAPAGGPGRRARGL